MNQQSITVILNSGSTIQEKEKLAEAIIQAFADNGWKANVVIIKKGQDLKKISERFILEAKEAKHIIAAAGGDGTINSFAALCYQHQATMGVIPLGTFNYFAREHGIPVDIGEAVSIIVQGKIKTVQVGIVQEKLFLNNASFGLYTKLIRQREDASSKFGRVRIVAALAAAYSLFDRQKIFSIKIDTGTEQKWHNTSMVFVGNNTLQLENIGISAAECTKQGRLAVIVMKESTRLEIACLLLRGAIKSLKDESKLYEFCSDEFEVKTNRKNINVVIDGEIIRCKTPLSFRIEKNALSVVAA